MRASVRASADTRGQARTHTDSRDGAHVVKHVWLQALDVLVIEPQVTALGGAGAGAVQELVGVEEKVAAAGSPERARQTSHWAKIIALGTMCAADREEENSQDDERPRRCWAPAPAHAPLPVVVVCACMCMYVHVIVVRACVCVPVHARALSCACDASKSKHAGGVRVRR